MFSSNLIFKVLSFFSVFIFRNNSAEKFHRGISQFYMYDPDEDALDDLLQDLSTLPIVSTGLLYI